MSDAITQKIITPLCVCVINNQQFKVTKASVQHDLTGVPSQFTATLPFADMFGNQIIDDATIAACWNNNFQPFDLYMGNSVNQEPAVLSYIGSGMVDSCSARYSTSEGELLQLSGPDFLGLFSQTQIDPTHYLNSKSSDIALTWAQNHNLIPHVTPTSQPIYNYYQQDTSYLTSVSETQLDLLTFLAPLEGFVFYVQGRDFYFGPPVIGAPWDAYYKDAGGHRDTVYDLELTRHPRGNKNILVVVQTYDRHHKSSYVIGQQKSQTPPLVPGASINFDLPVGVNPFSGAGLNFNTTNASPLVVEQAGAADATLIVQITAPVGTNAATAKAMAKTKLLQLLAAECTVTATTPGDATIQRNTQIIVHPGRVIQPATTMTNLQTDQPVVRTYYVSQLTHEFDVSAGFTTTFTGTNFPYGYQQET